MRVLLRKMTRPRGGKVWRDLALDLRDGTGNDLLEGFIAGRSRGEASQPFGGLDGIQLMRQILDAFLIVRLGR